METKSDLIRRYALGIFIALVGVVVRLSIDPALGAGYPWVIAGSTTAAAAFFAGLWPAVPAILIYHAIIDFLVVPPLWSLALPNHAAVLSIALSATNCLVIAVIVEAVARRASREQVGEILESVTDCFYALDQDWNFTYVNNPATRYFDRKREDLIGHNFWKLLPEKVDTVFEQSFRRAARIGQPIQFEAVSPVTHRWLDVHVYPSKNGVSVFFRDTTEASRARIGESRLNAILGSATDAIITINEKERITLFNHGAEQILRCRAVDALNQPIDKFIPDRFRSEHHNFIKRFGETGISFRQMGGERVLRALRADGEEFPMEAQISQSEVGGEKLFTVILRDVTERMRLEAERENLVREARDAADAAARANYAKDDFLAMVSHELRNPLTPILLAARMLRTANVDEVVVRKSAERIERSALSQAQLIEDLLDISRITSGKLRLDVQRIDLPTVIEAAVESLRNAAEAKNIRLTMITDPRAGFVSGDKERLQQVMWNLLSNAIKFTPKGGKVEVVVQRVNSHTEIVVRDSGAGIAPEFLPFVFERFRQAQTGSTRQHGGLGLGLAIVRNLVELHGGKVSAESTGEGKGSTFMVSLPLTPIRQSSASDRVHPTASGELRLTSERRQALQGIRILIVDDEPGTLEAIEETLTLAGAIVHPCSSAREAFAAIPEWRPAVLICDIGMPEEDGYSLIKKVRALPREAGGLIPALALTAYARVEDRMKVLSSGFQMHVPKPVQPDELITVILSVFERHGNDTERFFS